MGCGGVVWRSVALQSQRNQVALEEGMEERSGVALELWREVASNPFTPGGVREAFGREEGGLP